MSGAHLILPETMTLVLAVTKSPPCSKPFEVVSTIAQVAKVKSTDILAGVPPQFAGARCRSLYNKICRSSLHPHR